jgi:uncharacterized phage protein (TIGR01671 family)
MRDIKFRAWHKELNSLRQIAEINFLWKPSPNAEDLGGNVTVWDHPSVVTAMIKGRTDRWLFKDINLMQYTGLKDKNGKEIYEGDIVNQYNLDKKPTIVEYWYNSFTPFDETEEYGYKADELAVIGNIYENPELLHVA